MCQRGRCPSTPAPRATFSHPGSTTFLAPLPTTLPETKPRGFPRRSNRDMAGCLQGPCSIRAKGYHRSKSSSPGQHPLPSHPVTPARPRPRLPGPHSPQVHGAAPNPTGPSPSHRLGWSAPARCVHTGRPPGPASSKRLRALSFACLPRAWQEVTV